ncbi:MAG: NusG domain II-containing protein [Bacilli bacterium]|jgi:hypothetical protein
MNRSDFKLIIGIIILVGLLMIGMSLGQDNGARQALVYYDNELILTIDLASDKTYEVDGFNGKVVLETKNNKIRVIEEISPLHICSYQGWIDSPHEIIVCLPNKIVVKIDDKEREFDVIVR